MAHQRQRIAAMHEIFDTEKQLAAEGPAGMAHREIFFSKTLFFKQHDRQRIAHGQGRRCAGGRCQAERTGLFNANVQHNVAGLGER